MDFVTNIQNVARRIRVAIQVGTLISLPSQRLRVRHTRATSRAIESKLRLCVLHRDHYHCRLCGTPGDEITLEIRPLAPGIEDPNTLITLCARCSRASPQYTTAAVKEGYAPLLPQSSFASLNDLLHSSPSTDAYATARCAR